MKHLLYRLLLFVSIPLIITLPFSAMLSLNTFTFRSWETLLPYRLQFGGPFYVGQHLSMTEVGDLGVRTPYAVERPVEFITDPYGYRFVWKPDPTFDGIIIGDSFTVGSGLTRTETLTEVLWTRHDQNVYPFAPRLPYGYSTARDITGGSDPSYVIFQVIERNITSGLAGLDCTLINTAVTPTTVESAATPATQARIRFDSTIRNYFYLYQYMRALSQPTLRYVVGEDDMLFAENTIHSTNQVDDLEQIVSNLAVCQQWFEAQGVQFIFLPVPDKETVYFDAIPDEHTATDTAQERREFLRSLIGMTEHRGIQTVDLLTPYIEAREEGTPVYQPDDTHWSAIGVQIAAHQIDAAIQQAQRRDPSP